MCFRILQGAGWACVSFLLFPYWGRSLLPRLFGGCPFLGCDPCIVTWLCVLAGCPPLVAVTMRTLHFWTSVAIPDLKDSLETGQDPEPHTDSCPTLLDRVLWSGRPGTTWMCGHV